MEARVVVAAMTTATERLAKVAKKMGCPPDQLSNFLSVGYVPQPKQLAFHATCRACDGQGGPDQVGFGGARGPGKSHATFAQIALDDCRRFPGLKVLFLRKAAKQAKEQFEDLRLKVLAGVPHSYNRSSGVVSLWQDSRIFLGHFHNEADVDAYLGMEYDVIAIEEATTLSQLKYKTLRDSNRSSKPGVRPRIYATTNPGGVGHGWFKRTFVSPFQDHDETYTRFVPATIDDNMFVDEGYQRRLEENTGWRLRAYRYGDWDIAAGQFFTTFRRDLHVMPPMGEVPGNWRVWAAMDYGFTHPTVVYLLADFDGTIYVIDEHRESRWLPPSHAAAIKAMLARNGLTLGQLNTFVAGGDVFANQGDSNALTIAEQYAKEGITLTRANMDRINGAAEMLARLGDPTQGLPVRLKISERCGYLLECFPIMEHDPRRPEDVLKVDVDDDGEGGDDPYDALRYGIMVAKREGSFVMSYA